MPSSNLIKKTIQKFNQIFKVIVLIVAFFSISGFLFSSIPAQAQSNDDFLALSACTNPNPTPGTGGTALVNCFKQVSTIAVILGIVLGGILTARDVLTSYVPGQEVNAGKAMTERIQGLITGVILISMPGAILNLFNPATTNIDFLSGLRTLTRQNGSATPAPTSPSTPTKTSTDSIIKSGTDGLSGGFVNNLVAENITVQTLSARPPTIKIDVGKNNCSNVTVTQPGNKPARSFPVCGGDPSGPNHFSKYSSCLKFATTTIEAIPGGTCNVIGAKNPT